MVNGDAVRRTDGILAAIALADGVFLVVFAVEVELEVVHNFACLLRQSVFLDEREHGELHWGEGCWQLEDYTGFSVFELFFLVAVAHHAEEHTVDTDRGLDDVRDIALVGLWVEVQYLTT